MFQRTPANSNAGRVAAAAWLLHPAGGAQLTTTERIALVQARNSIARQPGGTALHGVPGDNGESAGASGGVVCMGVVPLTSNDTGARVIPPRSMGRVPKFVDASLYAGGELPQSHALMTPHVNEEYAVTNSNRSRSESPSSMGLPDRPPPPQTPTQGRDGYLVVEATPPHSGAAPVPPGSEPGGGGRGTSPRRHESDATAPTSYGSGVKYHATIQL